VIEFFARSNTVQRTTLILASILALAFCGGCSLFQQANGAALSPAMKLELANKTYASVANATAALVDQKIITDKPTQDVIYFGSQEAAKGLRDARAALGRKDFKTFDFILSRVSSVLDRLATIEAQHPVVKAAAAPVTYRSNLWAPPQSWHLYLVRSPTSGNSSRLTTGPSPGQSPRRPIAPSWRSLPRLPAAA
jgi:hypothetical protein